MSSITVQRLSTSSAVLLCVILCSSLTIVDASLIDSKGLVDSRFAQPETFDNGTENCPHTICLGISNGHFIDNPASCAAFFQCLNGRAIEGLCPSGTWFNERQQLCDAPWNVPCDAEQSEIIELECVTDGGPDYWISCEGQPGLHAIRHPSNCSSYYVCVSGIPVYRTCAPGLEFNAETQQCMKPERANCLMDGCPPYNLPMTFVASETRCADFSICYYGKPVPHSCADGLHWSQEDEWCTFPELANCDIDESVETTTDAPETTTEAIDTTTEAIETTTTETIDTTTEISYTIECRVGSPLFNPHPTDCTQYFLCGPQPGQGPSIESCAAGLYFDMDTLQCTTSEQATCYPGTSDVFAPFDYYYA